MTNEVTLGEVYRLVLKVDARLDAISQQFVGRAEYESDQEGIAERFALNDATHRHNKGESSSAHRNIHNRIDGLVDRIDSAEKVQKESRSKWMFGIVMAVVSPVSVIIVNILTNSAR